MGRSPPIAIRESSMTEIMSPQRPGGAEAQTMSRATGAIVVMGVCGCGKSTVGRTVADRLGCALLEGDAFHPPANVAKMSGGQRLAGRGPLAVARSAGDGAGRSGARAGQRRGRLLGAQARLSRPAERSCRHAGALRASGRRARAAGGAHVRAHGPLHAARPARQPAGDARAPSGGGGGADARRGAGARSPARCRHHLVNGSLDRP